MFSLFKNSKKNNTAGGPIPFPHGNHDYPLKFKESPRAKRLTLRLSSKEACLVLTMPPRTSKSQIDRFLMQCVPWVEKQLDRATRSFKIAPGEEVKLHGVLYTCETDPLRRKPTICNVTRTLRLPQKYTQKALHDCFKQLGLAYLTPLITNCAESLGQDIEKVTVRDTKTRWGSCSTSKTISLNWRLIFAPPEVAYYVCAHEAAHLIHMNHSKDFWKVVSHLCPEYKIHRKWLKMNGSSLLTI